jgi:aryl-alcohol dehydrogenase
VKTTAAVLRAANEPLVFEELDVAPVGDHEVLVRLVGVGVCHTDLGVIAAPAPGQTPIVLGHEGSGVVEETGKSVTDVAVGDTVVLSYAHCATCDHCAGGIPQHCRHFNALNLSGSRLDGTTPLSNSDGPVLGAWFGQSSWARHAVVSEQNVVKVDAGVPLELLGPLGCSLQTGAGAVLNTLKPPPGSSIAVFGVGSVGLAAVLAAVAGECTTVIAIDITQARLDKALELGATHAVNSAADDAVEQILGITDGMGVQYSVECIGLQPVVRAALECLQTPGVCASVGFQGVPNEITIDQGHLLFGKTLIGVIEGDAIPRVFIPTLVDLHQQGRFPFDKLIDTFPFADLNAAIDAVHHGDVTKAVVLFDTDRPGA